MPAANAIAQPLPASKLTDRFAGTRFTLLGAALLFALVFAAYFNSFNAPFIFDDADSITQNRSIRHFTTAFSPPSASGVTVSGRPVLNATFALNYALHKVDCRGYHVTNALIHTLAALVLWGLVRRTLNLPVFDGKFASKATLLAWFVATFWALHPLQTESVTYTVQRAESLVGLFYLLTLYCFIRHTETRAWPWFVATTLSCLLGMGSKEVMATAPFVIFLFDRAFISGSLQKARQLNGRLHFCLASTLILLGTLVISGHGRGGSVGTDATVTCWSYLCTQAVAIVRYLWLGVWPAQLTLDYGPLIVRNPAIVVPCALAIAGVIAVTIYFSIKRPPVGFLGIWFFAILAPSSSVIPVITQTMAEHRVYLSLAALSIGIVLLAHHWLRKVAWIFLSLLIVLETLTTISRNRIYAQEELIWQDTVAKQPDNYRARNNLGAYRLHKEKNAKAALPDLERAVELAPNFPIASSNLGQALIKLGQQEAGLALIEKALRLAPTSLPLHAGYGSALMDCGKYELALEHLFKALPSNPDDGSMHYNIANALMNLGRNAEAEQHYLITLAETPKDVDVLNNYGTVLQHLGRINEAMDKFEQAIQADPKSAKAYGNMGVTFMAMGKVDDGLHYLRESVRLEPQSYESRNNLCSALAQTGHIEEALPLCEALVQEKPTTQLYNNLGTLYGQLGRLDKAGESFRAALQLDPDNADAKENNEKLRAFLEARSAR